MGSLGLFVVQNKSHERRIQMDQDGCEATEVTGSDGGYFSSRKDDCVAELGSFLEGGNHDAFSREGPRGFRYCDSTKSKKDEYISANLRAIKQLHHCYSAFPNLGDLLKNSRTTRRPIFGPGSGCSDFNNAPGRQ